MKARSLNIKTLFYLFAFFSEFILIYPLYAVMFADKGLNGTQISSLLFVWSLTAFLLEVPSGAIADKYPRKHVLGVALLLQALGLGCWLLFPAYWGFLLGFILWGANSALASGTTEALVYDELKAAEASKTYAKVTGRMEMLSIIGVVGSGFAAAAMAPLGYAPILIFSIVSIIIAAVTLLFLPRARPVGTTGEANYWHYFSEGIKLVFRKRTILFIITFSAIVTGLGGTADEYYNLLFNEQGMDNTAISFWMAIVFLFGAAGSAIAHKLEGKRFPLTAALLLWAGVLLSATLLPPIISALAIGIFVGFLYIIKVLFNTYLQNEIHDATRATTTSVNGAFTEIAALMGISLFGITAQHTYRFSFQMFAGLIGIIALIYGFLHRRYALER